MFTTQPGLAEIIDRELVGFLTAVNEVGQPQTSPVWYLRQDEDLIVYNQPTSPRLDSIESNPLVAVNLRGDLRATGVVTMEGVARREADLALAHLLPGYVEKYGGEIERLGWTPEVFSDAYNVGIRIRITRVRARGLDSLLG